MHALMPIPPQLDRFIRLPSKGEAKEPIRFIRLETVVGIFVSRLFPGYRVRSQGAFRVLRDSDIEVQEEAEDLVRLFESALKRRRRGSVIRLEIEASMPSRLQRFVMQELKVSERESFVQKGLIGLDRYQSADRRRPARPEIPALSSAASRNASASIRAIASPRSARRTSSSTIPMNRSTSCCNS